MVRSDPATGERTGAPLHEGAGPVAALASARLRERWFVAAAGADRRPRVWDAATIGGAGPGLLGEFRPAIVHSLAVTEVDFAGGPRIAIAAGDQVHVWHPEGLDR